MVCSYQTLDIWLCIIVFTHDFLYSFFRCFLHFFWLFICPDGIYTRRGFSCLSLGGEGGA